MKRARSRSNGGLVRFLFSGLTFRDVRLVVIPISGAVAIALSSTLCAAQILPVYPRLIPDQASVPALTTRAAHNDVGAQVMLAVALERAQDYAGAVTWYTKAAQRGHSYAQNNLGVLYFFGRGIAADDGAALAWFRRSAAARNAAAQNNLGIMYLMGRGVQADLGSARHWLERAAVHGYAPAQFSLGYMFEHGEGVPADARAAARWYQHAARQDWAPAQVNLAVMHLRDGRAGRGYAQARKLLERAARQNCAEAEFDLAIMYRQGIGVAPDAAAADSWAARAHADGFRRQDPALVTFPLPGRALAVR